VQVPIEEVADISYVPGPMQISRENTFRRTYVGVNVRGRDVESVVNDIKAKLDAELDLPPGYYITYGGEFENLQRAKSRLSVVVPIALFLIFILLYFALNSFPQSVMIYMAIPLAAIGGIFFLSLRGMPFSISAGVGFIVLFGVAVLNGLVLISRFNSLKQEGMTDLKERILTGTKERLRPILLTATAAIMGFTPMAFSASAGAEVQRPLATVVIGGLISATLLTLIVLPVLYSLVEGKGEKKGRIIQPSSGAFILLIVCTGLLSTANPVNAQDTSPKKITSLDQAIAIGLTNNGSVLVAKTKISLEKQGYKSAFNPGKTSLGLQLGQYNSFESDFSFSIGQSFEFPTVYSNQKKLAGERTKGSRQLLAVTENELKRNIRQAWYQLAYLEAKQELLIYQDSIYARFVRTATLRYETQETSYLEKVSAETGAMEIQNKLRLLRADMAIQQKQLQVLVNDTTELSFHPVGLQERKFAVPLNGPSLIGNPLLGLTRQQVVIANAERAVQSSKMLPDLFIGYFNQSLIGTPNVDGSIAGASNRFDGLEFGISLPLFYGSYKAKVKSAELNREMAQTRADYYYTGLRGQYSQGLEEVMKFQSSLSYYKEKAIPQADLVIGNAQKSFENGAIDYVEYFQSLNQALDIKFNYLIAINGFNQALINLEYFIGQ